MASAPKGVLASELVDLTIPFEINGSVGIAHNFDSGDTVFDLVVSGLVISPVGGVPVRHDSHFDGVRSSKGEIGNAGIGMVDGGRTSPTFG